MRIIPNKTRLYISEDRYSRLSEDTDHPVRRDALRQMKKLADAYVSDTNIEVDLTAHNYHLLRARRMQARVVTLLAEYRRTGRTEFRDMVLADIRRMAEWEYWSWITWRADDPRPEAIFDLSYGENSATLALAFDALREELCAEEVDLFVDTARRRSLGPYLHITNDERPWYFGHPHSNWNTVCSGGAGMLALAMEDVCEESKVVIDRVEESILPYYSSLRGDGGWPEGVGYWNYGMRYGYMYLLSSERATGHKHPLFRRKGTAATLRFPLNFSPNGAACGFGDSNGFTVLPFHYAAADRLGMDDVVADLDRRCISAKGGALRGLWPDAAELALLHPGETPKSKTVWPASGLVSGLDWAYIADRMPEPSLYLSVRGGTTDAPHTHRDLMSFFCVVGDEKLIDNIPVDEYLDTTFCDRRFELYETSAASKNTIFINGVGIGDAATVRSRWVTAEGLEGVRIDATKAMGVSRDEAAAKFCGRAVLMFGGKFALVIDRIVVHHAALVESRLHTFYNVRFEKSGATVRGKKNNLSVASAATEAIIVKPGAGVPTKPSRKPDTMIRLVSEDKVKSITIAYVLAPACHVDVEVSESGKNTMVRVFGDVSGSVTFKTKSFGF
jgi:hypothetical protein